MDDDSTTRLARSVEWQASMSTSINERMRGLDGTLVQLRASLDALTAESRMSRDITLYYLLVFSAGILFGAVVVFLTEAYTR